MIKQWLNKICASMRKTQTTNEDTQKQQEYIGSLCFRLTADSDIDLEYELPNIGNKSLEQMSGLAEQYAEFLMAINDGYLKDEVVAIINNHADRTRDPKQKLFWDNILSFWAILHVEAQKNKHNQSKSDQPLIRPLSAFNITDN